MARADREHSGGMSEVGNWVSARRERLFGPHGKKLTQAQLAAEAGVNRDTVGAIENGKGFTQRKLDLVVAALDRLEEEAGIGAPPGPQSPTVAEEPERFELEVISPSGLRVVLRANVADREEIAETAHRLMRDLEAREAAGANETQEE